MFFVYILKSKKDNKFYIGCTGNLKDRIIRHNQGRERSTKNRKPFELEYVRGFSIRQEAIKYESYLKSLKSHKYIESLTKKEKRDRSSTG
ncbi:MAG: GIY-YIG nuclease family protein [Candidatus Dojkabacteria bacterium]|nr:GIY-YIG nuclease family protein [Candidatus Dojkabacteria bacterium]